MKATVVNAWQDSAAAWLALDVEEAQPTGRVEYIVSIPFDQEMQPATENKPAVLFRDLNEAARLDALIDAAKAKRAAQIAPVEPIKAPKTVTL